MHKSKHQIIQPRRCKYLKSLCLFLVLVCNYHWYWHCWAAQWKDMNQMMQDSNTARSISVMRTGPLSRPLVLAARQTRKIQQLWCQCCVKTKSEITPQILGAVHSGIFSMSSEKQWNCVEFLVIFQVILVSFKDWIAFHWFRLCLFTFEIWLLIILTTEEKKTDPSNPQDTFNASKSKVEDAKAHNSVHHSS